MAVPRPLLLALIGVLLVGATFTATRASRDRVQASGNEAAQQQPAAPSKPDAKPKRSNEPASKPSTEKAQSSAARRDEATKRARPAHRPLTKPAAVARAIGQHRVVVLAFFQPGADDRGTREAVDALRGRRLATVFTDKIDNLGRYGPVVGALGIHQAPAVVIVDSKRRAQLIEGYVDPESLAQEVADARG
jgi:hypothetical protein